MNKLTNSELSAAEEVTSDVQPGGGRLAGLKITGLATCEGWLVARLTKKGHTDAPAKVLIRADRERVGKEAITFNEGQAAELWFPIPLSLFDGAPHLFTLHDPRTEEQLCPGSKNGSVSFRETTLAVVEKADATGVSGYVLDADPDGRVLELHADDRRVASFGLGKRNPKAEARHRREPIWAFSFLPPLELYDGRKHELKLLWKGREARIEPGPRLVLSLDPADLPANDQRYASRMRAVGSSGVRGHVLDQLDDTPVTLEILVDGELVATVLADDYIPSLRTPRHSGFHGFHYEFPTSLMTGRERAVVIRIAGTAHQLPLPNPTVLFPLVALRCEEPTAASSVWSGGRRGEEFVARVAKAEAGSADGPLLSMIVLNWNGAHLLEPFLQSLSSTRFRDSMELILVDHGSTDESAAIVERFRNSLDVRTIERGANYTFSESNNLASALARGRYLVFANNDLVFTYDCLARMRDILDSNADVGLVGAKLLEPRYRGHGRWELRTHHRGVVFEPGLASSGRNYRVYAPTEIAGEPPAIQSGVVEQPAATAALALMRKEDFLAVGGFEEGYQYGFEDVDIALSLRRQGMRVVCDLESSAIHNRSATRERKQGAPGAVGPGARYVQRAAEANRALFARRFSRFLPRQILRQLISCDRPPWRKSPLRVTFVVTEPDIATAAGDYFTAHELALALRDLFGWETVFVSHQQFDVAATDILIVMRFDFDLGRIQNGNPGMVAVAWIRNRVDQWLSSPHFDKYHVVFASSQKAIEAIRAATGRSATLLPIASNAERFSKGRARPFWATDVCFTGHYWGVAREAVDVLDPRELPYSFGIWGQRWDQHPLWSRYWRGKAPYWEMPDVYASSKLVIDDSHPVTRDWNSLNSRVFDVLASGRLVLTNCVGGARELFGGRLPTFTTQDELRALVTRFIENPKEREALAAELSKLVKEKHTYDVRARTVRETLLSFAEGPVMRIAIKTATPDHAAEEQWGDHHFAVALKRALERLGHHVRIDILPEWYGGTTCSDEVVIVLRGLSRYEPQPGAINIMWLISHPDDVAVAELKDYDHVFVASESHAGKLKARLGAQVSALLQCTDPEVFRPASASEAVRHPVLFVGNSRGQHRKMIDWAVGRQLEGLAVYGDGWRGLIPERYHGASHIPNQALHNYYSGAGVLLNDHWPDMAQEGFISNRIFDAAACGALVVTDPVVGLADVFGRLVFECSSKADLKELVDRIMVMDDLEERRYALRELVLAHHTFDHRAAQICEIVQRIRGAASCRSQPQMEMRSVTSSNAAATPA